MCTSSKVFVVALFVAVGAAAASEGGDLSHGVRLLGQLVGQYLDAQPDDYQLGDGVHLVQTRAGDARASHGDVADGDGLLAAVERYLQTHEVRIRLPELMPGEGFARSFKDALAGLDAGDDAAAAAGTPRGKKNGLGGIMVLGLMMGKMMAALGLGGVGLLAMKALMVSALALMLSMIIGLKKLVSQDHDDGGHTVIHASHGHDHHRRRRDAADMAYQAWRDHHVSS